MNTLSVLTFNISGLPFPLAARARVRVFCRLVQDMDVDVINLQEVHTYGLFLLLKKYLPAYKNVSFKLTPFGPKAGLVTLSKLPPRSISFQPLPRGLHRGVLVTELDGCLVLNVHLTANTDGDWSASNRFYTLQEAQVVAVRKLIAKPTWRERQLVITGDFNLPKTSDLFQGLMEDSGLVDAFASTAGSTYHLEFLPRGREPQCIDHVLAKGGRLNVVSSKIVFEEKEFVAGRKRYLSNHMGLLVRLSRAKRARLDSL